MRLLKSVGGVIACAAGCTGAAVGIAAGLASAVQTCRSGNVVPAKDQVADAHRTAVVSSIAYDNRTKARALAATLHNRPRSTADVPGSLSESFWH